MTSDHSTRMRKGWKCFGLWKATFVLCCLSPLIKVDVNAVSQCINRVELLERLLIPSGLGRNINASSFIPPYLPSEVRTSGIGWCSDDLACNNEESHFIEFDFGAEVIIEAVAILRAGGSYVTHYNIEYAGSDRDYHCIGERVANEFVFDGNGTCNLSIEPSRFDDPLIARYVRVIPLQWVGGSVCLRMQLYGCTIEECHTENTVLRNTVTVLSSSSSSSDISQVFNLSNPWCASDLVPRVIILAFDESVYLTQLRVTGSSIRFNIVYHMIARTIYQNIVGFNSFGVFFNTLVIPLWPAINTTHLEFQFFGSNSICFAVELNGCLSSDVINHIEDTTTPPISADVGACRRQTIPPIPSRSLTSQALSTTLAITSNSTSTGVCQSTVSVVTVTTTVQVIATPMVQQQSEVSSDNNDDCNTIAIVVPTALVFVTLILIICINVMIVGRFLWKRRKSDNITTPIGNHTTCVVENDLYQSQDNNITDKTANTGITSQYTLAGPPDSPTLSDGEKALDSRNQEPVHYDYATEPPVDHSCYTPAAEYDVIMDIKNKSAERYVYSVPKAPPLVVNPSYATNDTVVHNIDEQ